MRWSKESLKWNCQCVLCILYLQGICSCLNLCTVLPVTFWYSGTPFRETLRWIQLKTESKNPVSHSHCTCKHTFVEVNFVRTGFLIASALLYLKGVALYCCTGMGLHWAIFFVYGIYLCMTPVVLCAVQSLVCIVLAGSLLRASTDIM